MVLLLLAAACDGAAKNDGLVLISPPMELREAEGAFRITAKYGILIRNSSAQTRDTHKGLATLRESRFLVPFSLFLLHWSRLL